MAFSDSLFFFFFLKEGGCWVAETRTRIKIKKARRQITGQLGSTATPTGGSSVVEQWTVKCSMQRSIGREFKSPSPEVFNFCVRARVSGARSGARGQASLV